MKTKDQKMILPYHYFSLESLQAQINVSIRMVDVMPMHLVQLLHVYDFHFENVMENLIELVHVTEKVSLKGTAWVISLVNS